MRQDQQVHSFVSAAREKEKRSACCVRNDKSGCVQTAEEECSVSATFFCGTCPTPLWGSKGHRCTLSASLQLGWGIPCTLCSCPLVPLCLADYLGRVGEVAGPPQRPPAGRREAAVWLCVPPGSQVGAVWACLAAEGVPRALLSPSHLATCLLSLTMAAGPCQPGVGWAQPLSRGRSFLPHPAWHCSLGPLLVSPFCRVCEQPASMDPHEWPDDITKWPVSLAWEPKAVQGQERRLQSNQTGEAGELGWVGVDKS